MEMELTCPVCKKKFVKKTNKVYSINGEITCGFDCFLRGTCEARNKSLDLVVDKQVEVADIVKATEEETPVVEVVKETTPVVETVEKVSKPVAEKKSVVKETTTVEEKPATPKTPKTTNSTTKKKTTTAPKVETKTE